MKTIHERIQELLANFKIDAEKTILKGEFEILDKDVYTTTIRVLGEIVEVWNLIETNLFRVRLREFDEWIEFDDKTGELENPEECKKMIELAETRIWDEKCFKIFS